MDKLFKQLARTLCAALAFATGASQAQAQAPAQAWPAKPLRVVVAFPAGTAPDTFARIYADFIAKQVGQPIVIDNRPGVAGNLASEIVAKAPADGHTLLYTVSSAFTVNPFIYAKKGFDPEKDLVPIGTTLRQGLVLVANPARLKATTMKEMLAAAAAEPGRLSYASYGAGTYPHLIMEWLLEETNSRMLHVPYRGGALNDLIGGQTDMLVEPIATAIPFVQNRQVRALAYTGPTRHPSLPDVPTLSETLPGMSLMAFHGIWAPAGTPDAVIRRFNAEMVAASKDPEVQQKIRALHCEPLGVTPAEMASMVKRDATIFSRIVRAKNIRID